MSILNELWEEETDNVYFGGVEYCVGDFIKVENELDDTDLINKLCQKEHGNYHFSKYQEDLLPLIEETIRKTLKTTQRDASEIDAILWASNQLEAKNNLNLDWLGKLMSDIGLSHSDQYHVGLAGCSSFHYTAKLATSLIRSQEYKNILVVIFDQAEPYLQRVYATETNYPYLTGDATSSCLWSGCSNHLDYKLHGKVITLSQTEHINTPSVEDEIIIINKLFDQTYFKCKVEPQEIDFLITNNYSQLISDIYAQLARVENNKKFTSTIESHAHCFGSDNIINLNELMKYNFVIPSKKILLFSAGPFQWGTCVLEKI